MSITTTKIPDEVSYLVEICKGKGIIDVVVGEREGEWLSNLMRINTTNNRKLYFCFF